MGFKEGAVSTLSEKLLEGVGVRGQKEKSKRPKFKDARKWGEWGVGTRGWTQEALGVVRLGERKYN